MKRVGSAPGGGGTRQVPLATFSLLIGQTVSYLLEQVEDTGELETRLADMGRRIGIRIYDLHCLRNNVMKREGKIVPLLQFILWALATTHLWLPSTLPGILSGFDFEGKDVTKDALLLEIKDKDEAEQPLIIGDKVWRSLFGCGAEVLKTDRAAEYQLLINAENIFHRVFRLSIPKTSFIVYSCQFRKHLSSRTLTIIYFDSMSLSLMSKNENDIINLQQITFLLPCYVFSLSEFFFSETSNRFTFIFTSRMLQHWY